MKAEGERMFRGKKVLVLGLAKSGVAVAKLLLRLGALVTVNEKKSREATPEAEELEALDIPVICGGHDEKLLDKGWDLIVKNPGIPYDHPFLLAAERRKIPIVTEVEIGYSICQAPIIAITGSNGKTTTTTLIYQMLLESKLNPLIAGNIGTVFCEVAERAKPSNWIVCELSSFQLLGTRRFKPHIAVLLNVYDAHLDYHRTKEHYLKSKKKMFQNQDKDNLAVLNWDQDVTRNLQKELNAPVQWFSIQHKRDNPSYQGTYIEEGKIFYRGNQGEAVEIIELNRIKLLGEHNLENIVAAVTVAMQVGASLAAIQKVLSSFTGVKHRLQFVGEKKGVRYFNDSKATNSLATQKALQAFSQPVILIAGGLDRGEDFSNLKEIFRQKVKSLIVYGQIAEAMSNMALEAGVKEVHHVNTVKEAVQTAAKLAKHGDTVLLSPAAASWDQFASFEERGDMFIQSVHMLR